MSPTACLQFWVCCLTWSPSISYWPVRRSISSASLSCPRCLRRSTACLSWATDG
ncbi:hypothetical protein DPMN_088548 [Dreissena polymorpha]|uniref:Uncharacterized protein n=1 Tax=Dreissena polymorpha TaxID=45954 RepID=A0A9D4KV23_DREPO|nr:hypothetical protein DPMN_088548 [Dreissena polymorpha]